MDEKEKARAYDKALERAKRLYEQGTITESLAYIFHELRESEDERIRKWLIAQLELKSDANNPRDLELMILKAITWLEKQKVADEEIIFRPVVGTYIRIAAKQALEKIEIGKKVVLAFNGAYILVNGKTVAEIDSEYDAWLEKQAPVEHFELKKGHWYMCHRAYCCRADHLTVKEGERFQCEKDGVVKGFAIKDPEKYFIEVHAPAPMEDYQNDEVRRRSTIQVLEYAKSLDAYNQYGKEDIDKDIAWLEKHTYTQRDVDDAYLKGINDTKNLLENRGKLTNFSQNVSLTEFEEALADVCRGWIGKEIGWKDYIIRNANALLKICQKMWNEVQDAPFEQKPTWSEEDEDNLRFAECHFKTFLTNTYYDTFCNWLKSLRTRLGGSEHDNVTSKTTNVGNSSITVEGMYNPAKDASV